MLSRVFNVVVLSSFILLATLSANADISSDVQQSIQAAYDTRDTSFVNKDLNGMVAPFTANAVIFNVNGHKDIGVSHMRRDFRGIFAINSSSRAANTTINEFTASKTGKEATVRILFHIELVATGSDGSPYTIGVDDDLRDHWIMGKNGWHITQERRLSMDATRDGTIFQHNGKPVTP